MNTLDDKEKEYFNYILQRNIENIPGYMKWLTISVVSEKIHDHYYNKGELVLKNLKINIPEYSIRRMVLDYLILKEKGYCRTNIYKKYRKYLLRTSWFFSLPEKIKIEIIDDFNNTIVKGIYESLKLMRFHRLYKIKNKKKD